MTTPRTGQLPSGDGAPPPPHRSPSSRASPPLSASKPGAGRRLSLAAERRGPAGMETRRAPGGRRLPPPSPPAPPGLCPSWAGRGPAGGPGAELNSPPGTRDASPQRRATRPRRTRTRHFLNVGERHCRAAGLGGVTCRGRCPRLLARPPEARWAAAERAAVLGCSPGPPAAADLYRGGARLPR